MNKNALNLACIGLLMLGACSSEQSNSNSVATSDENKGNYIADSYTPPPSTANDLPTRHAPTTTTEQFSNADGSITVITTTTNGVETNKKEETYFPGQRQYQGDANASFSEADYDTSNFEEAYKYARKAYRDAQSDVIIATEYLKKAMNYFEEAESIAAKVKCSSAESYASNGYDYAKKGYNTLDKDEVEWYAKKAMNEAESGESALEYCKHN